VKGRLLVLDIDGAPALACVVRQQLVKHVERKEATPVLAFPNEAAVWGAPA
jgi:hypothetical protein